MKHALLNLTIVNSGQTKVKHDLTNVTFGVHQVGLWCLPRVMSHSDNGWALEISHNGGRYNDQMTNLVKFIEI